MKNVSFIFTLKTEGTFWPTQQKTTIENTALKNFPKVFSAYKIFDREYFFTIS